MKKIIAVLMLFVMIIPLTGCRSGKNAPLQQEVERLEQQAEKQGAQGEAAVSNVFFFPLRELLYIKKADFNYNICKF